MTIFDRSTPRAGSVFDTEQKLVIVHDGTRGPQGIKGEDGEKGDQGDSINLRGAWASGTEYCPLDGVTWRSSAVQGVQSLYIQRSTSPCAPSTVEPNLDLARWEEIGATDISNITGAIWTIYQIDHMFEWVGTPVAFSFQSNSWVKADNRFGDETAIGVVREVIDKDRAVLQSTGEVPFIDAQVIYPDGNVWEPGRIYYVSGVRGRVERAPENPQLLDPAATLHPILMPTRFHESTPPDPGISANVGVVLPWRPDPVTRDYRVVGQLKFYYQAAGGETSVSGVDLQGNELEYTPGPNTDVFLNGVNLSELDDYTATDGTTITFAGPPLSAGDYVEIWTPDQPLDVVVQSTAIKVDNIEVLFDGFRTDFPLTYDGGREVQVQSTPNVMVWVDANPQEPFVDYVTDVDPVDPQASILRFTAAPMVGDRFWGLIALPVGDVVTSLLTRIEQLEARVGALEP